MTDDGRQRTELAILVSVICCPITMHTPKILVIPGSLHTGSHNSRLAALAAKEFALAEAEVTRISLADYPLPLFDAEMTAEVGPPQNAVQLQRMLRAHHGVFITSPE